MQSILLRHAKYKINYMMYGIKRTLSCFGAASSFLVLSGLASSCSLWVLFIFNISQHDDVIKWKHLPRYWPFVLGIHRSPVNSPHKGQWRGALMFSGDLRRHRTHYGVTVLDFFTKEGVALRQSAWLKKNTVSAKLALSCILLWFGTDRLLQLLRSE